MTTSSRGVTNRVRETDAVIAMNDHTRPALAHSLVHTHTRNRVVHVAVVDADRRVETNNAEQACAA